MPDLWVDVDAAVVVPVNLLALLDDTDFKTRETAIAFNAAGMDLVWNFVTSAGVVTQTAVTPTSGGSYDWTHLGDGLYTIEIPASAGASINNDTEGYGWFSGLVTGVLPWRGPVIGFRRAALNDMLIDGGTASTNLERFFDGTGYAGGTIKQDANLAQISGDTAAADNAEAWFDGTGYASPNSSLGVVGSVGTVTGNVNGSVASVTGAVGSVTGNVGGNVVGSVGSVAGAVGSVTGNVGGNVVGSVGSVLGNVGGNVVGSVGSVTALGPNAVGASQLAADAVAEIVSGFFTTAMAESYAADGVLPTIPQALYRIMQNLCEFEVVAGTWTTKKLDKSTAAETYLLDDTSEPTSRTRVT